MRKNIFNIPASNCFADVLACRLLKQYSDNKLKLSDVLILCANRRSVMTIKEAFIKAQGLEPTILPKIVPVGDIEEDEIFLTFSDIDSEKVLMPSVDALERQLIFTKIIVSKPTEFGIQRFSLAQALSLAKQLATLVDNVQNEKLDFSALADLVPEEYATHWQETLKFLQIITKYWPQILQEKNLCDVAEKYNLLLSLQAKQWKEEKTQKHIIAAGIYADYPELQYLLKVISELENGEIFINGLDRNLRDDDWENVEQIHPQYQFKQLLQYLQINREDVIDFVPSANKERERFVSEIMRPSQSCDVWRDLNNHHFSREGLSGFRLLCCETLQQEALAIAMIMREHIDEPEMTVALVSPDRVLSRMVAGELERWGISIDDSSGKPLLYSPIAIFLRQIVNTIQNDFSEVTLLSLLKNPLCHIGINTAEFRSMVRQYETEVLRKKKQNNLLESFIKDIKEKMLPLQQLLQQKQAYLKEIIIEHLKIAEFLGREENTDIQSLWKGEDGKACADFFAKLIDKADVLENIYTEEYLPFLENLMSSIAVRKQYGTHPRLKILGPVEARLNNFDYVIVAEVNEGIWPALNTADPWMSRSMKSQFGLPLPEKSVGISALDFANLLCQRNVYVTRAERNANSPLNKSRWWLRMETVLQVGLVNGAKSVYEQEYADWAKLIDRPKKIQRIKAPAPCPAVSLRPRKLSVSGLENLINNPYIAYAKYILKLFPLDNLGQETGSKDYGILIHSILQEFCEQYPQKLPDDAREILENIGKKAFEKAEIEENKKIFLFVKFLKTIDWFLKEEVKERENVVKIISEDEGSISFSLPAGEFTLTAKADRIDFLKDGRVNIIDYKTGKKNISKKALMNYKLPQLLVEGMIVESGGYTKLRKAQVNSLKYWPFENKVIELSDTELEKILPFALDKYKQILNKYEFKDMPYVFNPAPKYCSDKNYKHLSRISEWGVSGDVDEEETDDE